ncbi:hypothetical protein [Streptomyces flavofungini]|uniref:hypothetical protein n=1 Tax=Streptomyces flavofungini TaxID=68200 RepID=UPI0025B05AE2|nr:hypothetical protein [Streptomyces flavofungini]WJV44748.1 hypothetical protein QUY26_03910 [Streptomyces flavofungini]
MSVLIIALLLLLIVLGFEAPLLWLFAAALVYLLVRGRDRGSIRTDPADRSTGSDEGRSGPKSYREYSDRRKRKERWERRYRRRHPSSTSSGR